MLPPLAAIFCTLVFFAPQSSSLSLRVSCYLPSRFLLSLSTTCSALPSGIAVVLFVCSRFINQYVLRGSVMNFCVDPLATIFWAPVFCAPQPPPLCNFLATSHPVFCPLFQPLARSCSLSSKVQNKELRQTARQKRSYEILVLGAFVL